MRLTYKLFRYIIYVLEIYFLYSLQQTPNLSFNILGVKPIYLIAGFVSIILHENKFVSLTFGVLIGLLMDLIIGNILGCHAIVLGLLGYLINVTFEYFIKANLFSAMFVSGFTSFVVTFLNFFITQLLYGEINIQNVWTHKYVPIIIYTMVITLPIYLFNRTVSYFTGEYKNEMLKF